MKMMQTLLFQEICANMVVFCLLNMEEELCPIIKKNEQKNLNK